MPTVCVRRRNSVARPAGTGRLRASAAALPRYLKWLKALVFLTALIPLGRLAVLGMLDRLSANPIEFITRSTGLWTLVFLCITLAVTPVRRLSGWSDVARMRRMLGLFAFFYGTLHFLTYVWFDQWFDVGAMVHDIIRRPFITVGFAAFVLMIPLAATSPLAMMRRLGRRWQTLHRMIYPIAVLAVLHFWWMRAGKHNFEAPAIYGGIIVMLLSLRLWWRLMRARQAVNRREDGF